MRQRLVALGVVAVAFAAGLACGNPYSAQDPAGLDGGSAAESDGGTGGGDGAPGSDASAGDTGTLDANASTIDANVDASVCPRGVCPIQLVGTIAPQRLAVGAAVYWASLGGVGSVALDGTSAKTLPLAGVIAPTLKRGVAVDPSGAVYVTMPGAGKGAVKCTADLTSCAPGFIGAAGDVSSIAVTATNVHVGIFDDQSAAHIGGIYRTQLDGTMVSPYTMVVDKVLDLQVVGATTYFRTSTAVNFVTPTTSPSLAVTLAGEAPLAFVVQGSKLFVATTNHHVEVCTLNILGGCAPITAQVTVGVPAAMTADSTHVYWVEGGAAGSVHRCALPDCVTSELLAVGQAQPSDIVVDATSVYWATFGDATGAGGAIMKLVK